MDNQYPYVGVRIISRLKDLGMTQVELCHATGLSTTAMSSYCTGKRTPETTALYRISKALKTSMEWILTGEDTTNEDAANEDIRASLPSCDGSPLLDEEADLVAMYRLLPDEQKEDVFDLVHLKYRKHVERKKESIYWTYAEDRAAPKSGPAGSGDPQSGTA